MMVLATRCCQLYTIPDSLVDYRVVWLHQIHKTDPNDGSGYKMLSVVYYSRWPGRLYRVVWLHQIHKTDPNDGSGYKMLSVLYYSRWPGRLELSGCTKLTQMMVLATRCCQLYTIPDGLVD